MTTTLRVILLALMLPAAGLGSGCARLDSAQPPSTDNRPQFAQIMDSLERVYEKMASNLENLEAKTTGWEQSLPEKAHEDPQHPIVMKIHAELVDDVKDIQSRYAALSQWVGATPAPTQDDLMKLGQASASLTQDLAQVITGYGKLEIELISLQSRHPK